MLKEREGKYNVLEKEISDLKELITVLSESEIEDKIEEVERQVSDFKIEILLNGEYDRGNAILSIKSGAGGRDAEDWTCLLIEMYKRYCSLRGWTHSIVSESFGEGGGPEGRIGLKEVSIEIKGKMAYGFLKKETGIHRLVRISPFSSKDLRHTSFSSVEVLPEIKGDIDIELKEEDLKIETCKSSGHGGQNVNKRETAIRIIHTPTGLSASSQKERMQSRNREQALKILKAKLYLRKEQEKEDELNRVKDKKAPVEFGHQIRSYVLHPYTLVKDHRTNVETSNVVNVLNGNLDLFIQKEISL